MRKLIVFENVTVDGFMAGPQEEIDWAIRDDEVTENSREGQGIIDLFMFGRVTYDMMASFWPTEAGKSANPVFANALNNTPKIVFSRTMEKADWEHTTVLVEQLTNLGLIDEYHLMVNPVLLGKGQPLFNNIRERMNLKLFNAKTFRSGIVLLQYQPD
ncbi:MAG: dihydrofolate reductase family protein [Ktedonobacteraceae bacterium]